MKKNCILILSSLLVLIGICSLASAETDSANPVTIDFNDLPPGTRVLNQYLPRVQFSATNFHGATYYPQGFDLYADPYPPPYNLNHAIIGDYNPTRGFYPAYGFDTFLDFGLPVNNLSFNILNFRWAYGGPIVYIDVYSNGFYYNTYYVYGNFNQGTVPVTLPVSNITDIEIYRLTNRDQFNNTLPLYFDDFTFTPDLNVSITNPRVSGSLNGTTQYALVGGNIVLNSAFSPSGRSGGAYSWTITGPYTLVSGSTSSSSLTIRPTEVGTVTARATYTLNGFSASGLATINTIVPTLSSFNAGVGNVNTLARGRGCSFISSGATYTLGCYPSDPEPVVWYATAAIPSHTYLTDPAQSGVKFKQGVNFYAKRINNGRVECLTLRNPQSDYASGWALDTDDPYNGPDNPPQFFGTSNSLTMFESDAPGVQLDSYTSAFDAYFISADFEDYVFFFTGDPHSPTFEYPKPLHLTGSAFQADRPQWTFGGTAYFDSDNSPILYREQSSLTTAIGVIPGTGTNNPVSLQRVFTGAEPFTLCSGAVDTHNPIDGSSFFVYSLYFDVLGYGQLGLQPDVPGWNFWTTQITRCALDLNCIYGTRSAGAYHGKRSDVAKAFFDAANFNQTDPAMAHPPGSPGFDPAVYNPAFTRHCYLSFFRREPDSGGWSFWVNNLNSTGDYLGVIDAFVNGYEYRIRTGLNDPHY